MPNRLAASSSPYLRQHAANPVDWHEWGEAALAEARDADKPILLSIGYAACHWCHVMAHESFEDEATAALMNRLFVNIKVDREERPDLDAIYMQAVQAMTGHGGWPMTIFLTPAGEPFHGGTYFPPEDRHGMPSFRRVLESVADAWATRRDGVTRTAEALRAIYAPSAAPLRDGSDVTAATLARAAEAIARGYDARHGGFGGAPKFPPTMVLDFLLRHAVRTGAPLARSIALATWRAMAGGGISDQAGGGWHRYTVDAAWLVPHFEKMLYDNALLVRLGAHLWQLTGDAEVRQVTERALDWLAREMTSAEGGWWSSLDADSEGHEGRFYVWTAAEFAAACGADAEVLASYWGVTAIGNFEGANILHLPRSPEQVATRHGVSAEGLAAAVARGRSALMAIRAGRVRPGLDDKIVAGWNGLMLRGVCECARVFGRARDRAAALRAAAHLWEALVREGRVWRVVPRAGATPIAGVLEDYAALALGFVAMFELTLDATWLGRARTLAASIEAHFRDADTGTYFDTAHDAEALITRPRDPADNAVPSGTSLAVELELMLAEHDGDAAGRARAARVLASHAEAMARYPSAFGHMLGAADLAVHGAVTVGLVGDPADARFEALREALAQRYVPGLVLAANVVPGAARDLPAERVGDTRVARPTRDDRAPAAYVCRHFTCERPVTTPGELHRVLDRVLPHGAG
ncbi:MAG: thioredoxin domain-containing protein [Gemmatimonadetes bacterium]|nr:thioredoxin domain-containing protein [Gemmatimonadota bacterium]